MPVPFNLNGEACQTSTAKTKLMMKDADKKRLLHEMLFARRFEERCYEAYVERNLSLAAMVAEGMDRGVVEQVVGLIDRSEYKRRQAAPGIKITSKAFGIGRRYPIVADYRGLHKG